jgi:hypothetical protein
LGHPGGFALFKGEAVAEPKSEVSNEKNISTVHSAGFSCEKQVPLQNSEKYPFTDYPGQEVFIDFVFWFPDFTGIGISLLRAPPVSPF